MYGIIPTFGRAVTGPLVYPEGPAPRDIHVAGLMEVCYVSPGGLQDLKAVCGGAVISSLDRKHVQNRTCRRKGFCVGGDVSMALPAPGVLLE